MFDVSDTSLLETCAPFEVDWILDGGMLGTRVRDTSVNADPPVGSNVLGSSPEGEDVSVEMKDNFGKVEPISDSNLLNAGLHVEYSLVVVYPPLESNTIDS